MHKHSLQVEHSSILLPPKMQHKKPINPKDWQFYDPHTSLKTNLQTNRKTGRKLKLEPGLF